MLGARQFETPTVEGGLGRPERLADLLGLPPRDEEDVTPRGEIPKPSSSESGVSVADSMIYRHP